MPFQNRHPLSELHKVPPFLMHAIAIKPGGRERYPLEEIVARSGLTERTYLRTVRKCSWKEVKTGTMEGVLAGTGVNPWDFARHREFLRKHGADLKFINARQRKAYMEVASEWIERQTGSNQRHVESEGAH